VLDESTVNVFFGVSAFWTCFQYKLLGVYHNELAYACIIRLNLDSELSTAWFLKPVLPIFTETFTPTLLNTENMVKGRASSLKKYRKMVTSSWPGMIDWMKRLKKTHKQVWQDEVSD